MPEPERRTFRGFRRADGRIGTRNFVLVVPTSMCASHEASQIATIAEFTAFSRERFPNVDGVVAIPHNKGCGCQDGSTIEVMLRTLGNYADHPNVGGVVFIGLGCEKTNLTVDGALSRRTRASSAQADGSHRHPGGGRAIQAALHAEAELGNRRRRARDLIGDRQHRRHRLDPALHRRLGAARVLNANADSRLAQVLLMRRRGTAPSP